MQHSISQKPYICLYDISEYKMEIEFGNAIALPFRLWPFILDQADEAGLSLCSMIVTVNSVAVFGRGTACMSTRMLIYSTDLFV